MERDRREPALHVALDDVALDLVGVRAAEDVDLLHAARREELERVLYHRHASKRHEHLGHLERHRPEVRGKRVGEHDRLQHFLLREVVILFATLRRHARGHVQIDHDERPRRITVCEWAWML